MRALLVIPLLAAAACGAPASINGSQAGGSKQATCDDDTEPPQTCPEQASNLIAGQTIDSGDVHISNDSENLYIEIMTQDGWLLTETHIFAGTGAIPANHKGIPVPGHFPYQSSFSPGVTSYTEVIPLSDLGIACDGELKIAVHAVVERPSGNGTEEQTAWGDGQAFSGPRWGFFSLYTGCCEPPPPPPPEQCEAEPVEYWTAADPSTWPIDLSDWLFCWSESMGGVRPAEVMAMEPSSFWVQLSQQYIAAKENTSCLVVDCIIGPALSRTNYLTNDCAIDDSELEEAQELYALFVDYNTGNYNPPFDACW